ncbi:hypothetical protein Y1Q_0011831 [Alligator mississippiensis]|uniref:CG-1 domain-containing protein n=1 Tax=Alligator mississippiensis TaxID=8496 RepID=A0A151LYN1_ALLMI|nr:hypothetical protein Y1Q_0011831 [Alligator mississippiensis]
MAVSTEWAHWCLYGCYVHSSIIPTFHRRCYWLLQVLQLHAGERHQLAAGMRLQGHHQSQPGPCVCASSGSERPRTGPGC